MAKRKTATKKSTPPGVPVEPEYVATPPPEVEAPKTVTRMVTSTVLTCSVPFVDGMQGYSRNRIDCWLTGHQATKLKGILQGLEEKDAKLGSGKRVTTQSHALQWMIENLE